MDGQKGLTFQLLCCTLDTVRTAWQARYTTKHVLRRTAIVFHTVTPTSA